MASSNPRVDSLWLYRHGDLVLGPVSPAAIEEMLHAGELTGQTELSELGSSDFRPASAREEFRLIVAKAEARQRVLAAEREANQARQKSLMVRLGIIGAVAVVLVGAAIGGARYVAVHGLGDGEDAEALITVEPPTISLARGSARAAEGLLAYGVADPDEVKPTTLAAASATQKPGTPRRSRSEAAPKAASGTKQPGALAAAGPDGLEMATLDQAGINAVVASKQKTLYKCLQIVARTKPGQRNRIPIEFVIGNGGQVEKLWIDHPEFKAGELHECMIDVLKKWRFKAYEGEQATVALAFNVG